MEEFNRRDFMLAMNQAKRFTTEQFIEKSKQIYGDRFDYSETEYLTARDKISIICPEHGKFTILPQHHLRGKNISGGCRGCGLKAINRNRRFTQEQFLERVKNIKGLSFDKTVYIDKRKRVVVTCKIHGDYKTSAEVLLKGNGCPKCKYSFGESQIEIVLSTLGVEYEVQKSFPTLRHIRLLKFDFYLPSYNVCIEFDGEQHHRPIEYWGGEKAFKELQIKDSLKNSYCKVYNIPLLRVRFDEQNIESVIKKFLKI